MKLRQYAYVCIAGIIGKGRNTEVSGFYKHPPDGNIRLSDGKLR